MTGEPCGECACVLEDTERACPVCGTKRPRDSGVLGPELTTIGGIFFGGTLGFLSGCVGNPEAVFFWALAGAASGGVALGLFAQRQLRRFKADPLARHETEIRARLQEIDDYLDRLGAIRSRMETESHPDSGAAQVQAVRASEELFLSHRACYQERLWDLKWARWLRRVDRLADGWDRLSCKACERRLRHIDLQIQAGEALRAELDLAVPGASPGAAVRRERIGQGLDSARELKRGLLGRQARTLVQRISALDTGKQEALTVVDHEAIQRLAVLSARSEVGEFEAGWRELELEHARVSAELESSQLERVWR